MKKFLFLLFFALLSLKADDKIDIQSKTEKDLDNLLKEIVTPKSCTAQREELCQVLIGFQNANDKLPEKVNRSFSVGRMFSAHMNFKQTWEYGRTWLAIIFKNEDSTLSLDMFKIESESDQEIEDTKELISQLEEGKIDKMNSLYRFLADLDEKISITECKKHIRTFLCKSKENQFNEIYVRFTKDYIYVLTFGGVSKMKGSWDHVPGFYFSRLPIPKNELKWTLNFTKH